MQAIWDFFNYVIKTAPVGFWPLILGTLISWGGTQRFKFLLPESYSVRLRARMCQIIAFWLGLVCTVALWPTRAGVLAGICVGVWSPVSYAVFVRIIGMRWPQIRDTLSQDVRDPTDKDAAP